MERITVKMSAEDKARLQRYIKLNGTTVSAYLRNLALDEMDGKLIKVPWGGINGTFSFTPDFPEHKPNKENKQ